MEKKNLVSKQFSSPQWNLLTWCGLSYIDYAISATATFTGGIVGTAVFVPKNVGHNRTEVNYSVKITAGLEGMLLCHFS